VLDRKDTFTGSREVVVVRQEREEKEEKGGGKDRRL
jgi:hypothetical protein